MATTQTQLLQPNNGTDADYRAWTKFVRDAFLASGWVQTGDTGQADFTTLAHPTVAEQKSGYIIVRMADALQGGFPLFMRVDFGNGSGSTNRPAIWLTIGTGSNGSGTITGAVQSPGGTAPTIQVGSSSTTATSVFCYSSGNAGRFHLMLWDSSNATFAMTFSLERGRNSSGVVVGTTAYLIFSSLSASGRIENSRVLDMSGGTSGVLQTTLCCIVPPNNQEATQENYGIGLILPIADGAVVQRPATGYLITGDADWLTGSRMVVYVHGDAVVYRRTQAQRPSIGVAPALNTHITWMRYD